MVLTSSRVVIFSGVVSLDELDSRLRGACQDEWCTNVRLRGLLMLIDFVRRNHTVRGVSISANAAHDYISNIKRPKSYCTIREPLAVLCAIEILRCVSQAINGWHVKKSAVYAFDDKYCNRHLTLKLALPAKLAAKRESAKERREKRLNKRYSYRETLLSDLDRVSFASDSRSRISELLGDANFGPSTMRAVQAVDGT